MLVNHLPILFLSGAFLCSGQTKSVADPTLDSAGLPAYLKVLARPAAEPWRKISEKQRFDLYASLNFSPYAGLSSLASAAISQAIDSPHEWGQGWGPYGVRAASSYGSSFVAYTITYGTSAIFRDDNRYFRSNRETFRARLGYVIISPYLAHSDPGKTRFSTSSFLGGAGGAGIPLLWSPASWQGWNNVAVNYAIWYGGLAGVNLVREFYPSLVRHHLKKAQRSSSSINSALPK